MVLFGRKVSMKDSPESTGLRTCMAYPELSSSRMVILEVPRAKKSETLVPQICSIFSVLFNTVSTCLGVLRENYTASIFVLLFKQDTVERE